MAKQQSLGGDGVGVEFFFCTFEVCWETSTQHSLKDISTLVRSRLE